MSLLVFTIILINFAFVAGLIGSLTGLGGGVVIIPVLVLVFHVPIHYAMGASLISVIATSSSTAGAYLQQGYANLRVGMLLEIPAVTGAIIGAWLITIVPKTSLMILFSVVLFLSAYLTLKRREETEQYETTHPWATFFNLEHDIRLPSYQKPYHIQKLPQALGWLGIAGILSGLLGIGSGVMKVLAMDQGMKLPYKVATATSNFMIGMTAAASAGIYLMHGYIIPIIASPVLVGVIMGAWCGTKLMFYLKTYYLRLIFSIAIFLMGIQMLSYALFHEIH